MLKDNQNQFNEEKNLFKPINESYPKKSSIFPKKIGPESKIIIYEDNNNINIDINNEADDIKDDFDEIDTLESTKGITIEIHNEKIPLFYIKKNFFKIEKNKGRKRKSRINIRSIHNKYSRDNILRKIKVKFLHKLIKYINKIISNKYQTKIKKLIPLESELAQNNTKIYNKILLNLKLKDIFMNFKISQKFRLYEASHNKKVIETIYKENILELVEILESTFLEAFIIFKGIQENEKDKLNDMEKLNTVVEEIKNKENDKEYIDKFKKVAMDFEKFYFNKKVKN